MTEKQAKAQRLRQEGLSYREIGERMGGISHKSAWAAVNPEKWNAGIRARRAALTPFAEGVRERNRKRTNERDSRLRAEGRVVILEVKAERCWDCDGVFEARRLHFHHRPGEVKLFDIGSWVRRTTLGLDRLRAEIAKCDVLCQPCHTQRHRMLKAEAGSDALAA